MVRLVLRLGLVVGLGLVIAMVMVTGWGDRVKMGWGNVGVGLSLVVGM